jgi:methionine-S-sulfoxide reductase
MEHPFDRLTGVISTTSGYTGGKEVNPSYRDVASGKTGHTEAVEIVFDPSMISYAKLLDAFWKNINPTQVDGQFVDIGRQYRTAIFYHSEEQKKLAFESKEKLVKSGHFDKNIVTEIVPAMPFYRAEEYHQDYYRKNPLRYHMYRSGSGRDQYLEKVWGKPKK